MKILSIILVLLISSVSLADDYDEYFVHTEIALAIDEFYKIYFEQLLSDLLAEEGGPELVAALREYDALFYASAAEYDSQHGTVENRVHELFRRTISPSEIAVMKNAAKISVTSPISSEEREWLRSYIASDLYTKEKVVTDKLMALYESVGVSVFRSFVSKVKAAGDGSLIVTPQKNGKYVIQLANKARQEGPR